MMKLFTYIFLVPVMFLAGMHSGSARHINRQELMEELEIKDTIRIGHYRILISHGEESELSRKRSKLIAVAADLLTGPLGGHRIYLGTKPWVPVVYALTLGGGMGFLPVTDLFVIIFTSDLSKYTNNPQLIMWL